MIVNGVLDVVESGRIAGWLSPSEEIAFVDIFINGICAASVKCDSIRADLRNLGIRKDGLGGFSYEAALKPLDIISVFCSASGAELRGSPKINQVSEFVSYGDFRVHPVSGLLGIGPAHLDSLIEAYLAHDPQVRLATNVLGEVVGLAMKNRNDLPCGIIVLRKNKRSIQRCIKAYRGFLKRLQGFCPRLLIEFGGDEGFLVFEFVDGEVLHRSEIHRMVCERNHPVMDRVLAFLCNLKSCNGPGMGKRIPFSVDSFARVLLQPLKKLRGLEFREALFLIKIIIRFNFSAKVFSHGDFHSGNILVGDDNRICILDWDKYGFYPIGFDLALLVRNQDMHHDIEAYDTLLNDYAVRLNLGVREGRELAFNFWSVVYLFFLKHESFRKSEHGRLLRKRIRGL